MIFKSFRTGIFFFLAYLMTFIVMVIAYIKEYQILSRLAEHNQIPAKNLLITSGVFAFSFIVRTLLDLTAVVDAKAILGV